MRTLITLTMCLGLLTACGDSNPPQKTVFDPMLETKQKARDVEKKLEESAQKQREQMERNEQGESK